MQTKVYSLFIGVQGVKKLPGIYNRDIENAQKGLRAAASPNCSAEQKETTQ